MHQRSSPRTETCPGQGGEAKDGEACRGRRTRRNSPQTKRDRRREASVGRRAFLAPKQRAVEVQWTGGGAREEEGVVGVGGEGQVVASKQARETREDVVRVRFGPKCSPN
jgi:hypothetical protein